MSNTLKASPSHSSLILIRLPFVSVTSVSNSSAPRFSPISENVQPVLKYSLVSWITRMKLKYIHTRALKKGSCLKQNKKWEEMKRIITVKDRYTDQ